jgi:hypothetical protein
VLYPPELHGLEALGDVPVEALPNPAPHPAEDEKEPPCQKRDPDGFRGGHEEPSRVVSLVVLGHDDGEPLLRPGGDPLQGLARERVDVAKSEEENAAAVDLQAASFGDVRTETTPAPPARARP